MKRHSFLQIVGALFACALLPVMTVGAGKGRIVERPFKAHGYTVVLIDFTNFEFNPADPGSWVVPWDIAEEVAVGSHTGLWSSTGGGTYNVVTGIRVGSGTITVANGDVIEWTCVNNVFTWTSGTGRFASVSGSCVLDETEVIEPEDPYLRITITWTASGKIAY
jgi:hypothetical protein